MRRGRGVVSGCFCRWPAPDKFSLKALKTADFIESPFFIFDGCILWAGTNLCAGHAAPAAGNLFADEAASVPASIIDDDLVEVPVTAFGQTLHFILDTGFAISAIDTQYQSQLGTPIDVYTAVSPLGTQRNVPIYHCPDITLAGRPLGLDKMAGLDLKMLAHITGRPCDGVLGMDWFVKNIVTLDFNHHILTLGGPDPDRMAKNYLPVTLQPPTVITP